MYRAIYKILSGVILLFILLLPRPASAEGFGVPDPRGIGNFQIRSALYSNVTGTYDAYARYLVLGRVWSGTQFLGLIGSYAVNDGRQDVNFGRGLGAGFLGSPSSSNPRVLRDYTNGTRIFDLGYANTAGDGEDNLFIDVVEVDTTNHEYIALARSQTTPSGSIAYYEGFLVKFDRFGKLITTFGTNGILDLNWQSSTNHAIVRGLALDPNVTNPRILVVGAVGTYSGGFVPKMEAYNITGATPSVGVVTNPACTPGTQWTSAISSDATPVGVAFSVSANTYYVALSDFKFSSTNGNRKSYAWKITGGATPAAATCTATLDSHPFMSSDTNFSNPWNDTVLAGVRSNDITGSTQVHFVGATRTHTITPALTGPFHCFIAHTDSALAHISPEPGFVQVPGYGPTLYDSQSYSVFNSDVTSPEGPRYDCFLNDVLAVDAGASAYKLVVGGAAFNLDALAGPIDGSSTTCLLGNSNCQVGNYDFFVATTNNAAASLKHISKGPEGPGDDVINKLGFFSGTITSEDFYAIARTANTSRFAGAQTLQVRNIEDWDPISTTGEPTARGRYSAVWTGQKMVVWGGFDGTNYKSDGAIYDPVADTWGAVENTTGVPAERADHPAVWNGYHMFTWGGQNTNGVLADGYKLTFTSTDTNGAWTAMVATSQPSVRYRHTLNFTHTDTNSVGYLAVFGGANAAGTAKDDGGLYNVNTNVWTAIAATGTARAGHVGVWDSGRKKLIVWGGYSGNSTATGQDTGGEFDPFTSTWTAITTGGGARTYAAGAYDGRNMLIFGGRDTSDTVLGTGNRYNTLTPGWTAMSATLRPSARDAMAAVWNGASFMIWGGWNGSAAIATGAYYNPIADTWTTITATGAPTARYQITGVWTGERFLVPTGKSATGASGQYTPGNVITHPSRDVWSTITETGVPTARSRHSTVWTGKEMIVWGGLNSSGNALQSGGRYDPVANTWTGTDTNDADTPGARKNHTAVWTGTEMIVWGGSNDVDDGSGDSTTELSTGSRYDPSEPGTSTWIPVTNTSAPTVRQLHQAVWAYSGTNSTTWNGKMVVWGGIDDGAPKLDGKYYRPDNDSWTALTGSGFIGDGRIGMAMWFDGKNIGIWGGNKTDWTSPTDIATGSMLDLSANSTWVTISTLNAPTARTTNALWTGKYVVMFGENTDATTYPFCDTTTGQGRFAEKRGARYDPFTNSGTNIGTWLTVATTNIPSCTTSPSIAWTGSKFLVWGGASGAGTMSSAGAAYDPIYDVWTTLATTSPPTARKRASGIWTGKTFFVWGGVTSADHTAPLTSSGLYQR